MREIKFQVVVGNKIVAHEFSNPAFNMGNWSHVLVADGKDAVIRPGGYTALNLDPVIRRQYIDKKDKNGKEIYEGDIVKEDNFSLPCWITFAEASYHLVTNAGYHSRLCEGSYIEVIGNLWENPELLEAMV